MIRSQVSEARSSAAPGSDHPKIAQQPGLQVAPEHPEGVLIPASGRREHGRKGGANHHRRGRQLPNVSPRMDRYPRRTTCTSHPPAVKPAESASQPRQPCNPTPHLPPTRPAIAITDEASPFALRSPHNRPRTAMHLGCGNGLAVGECGGWWPVGDAIGKAGRSTRSRAGRSSVGGTCWAGESRLLFRKGIPRGDL
jgi:hypothetical protein